METIVIIFVNLFVFYFVSGAIFSLFFLWKGLEKVDHNTKDSSIWFKLLIFPGLCAFWPLFIFKWLKN